MVSYHCLEQVSNEWGSHFHVEEDLHTSLKKGPFREAQKTSTNEHTNYCPSLGRREGAKKKITAFVPVSFEKGREVRRFGKFPLPCGGERNKPVSIKVTLSYEA